MAYADLDRQPTLVGPTLTLRPLRPDDAEALAAVASDPLIWEQHPEPTRWQRPVFQRFLDAALESGGALVAIDRASGAIVGSSRYHPTADVDEVEIGWSFLARSHWGGPANREMKRLMLDHAYGAVGTVVFRIGAENWRSRKAVEKLGATFAGPADGNHGVPAVAYRLTREAWARQPD